MAVEDLVTAINDIEDNKPDAAVLILGDFNHASLDQVLPQYQQYVSCPTRGNKCLDLCYCNIKSAYKAHQRPQLGHSDHNMVYLTPTYKQKLKTSKPIVKTVKCWSNDNKDLLRGCFDCTDWSVFCDTTTDLNEAVDTVNDYIKFCVDMLIPEKQVKIYPNNKPWVTNELRSKVKAKRLLLHTGDREAAKHLQYEVDKTVTHCKEQYKNKIES